MPYEDSEAQKLYKKLWFRKYDGWELFDYVEIELGDQPYTVLICREKGSVGIEGKMQVFLEKGHISEEGTLRQFISSIWKGSKIEKVTKLER